MKLARLQLSLPSADKQTACLPTCTHSGVSGGRSEFKSTLNGSTKEFSPSLKKLAPFNANAFKEKGV